MKCPDPKFKDLKPELSNRAFWDIDMSQIDYWEHDAFVIQRVFEHGTVDETLEVLIFYGDDRVKEVLTKARHLPEDTIYYASGLLRIDVTDFECYTTKRYTPNLSMS